MASPRVAIIRLIAAISICASVLGCAATPGAPAGSAAAVVAEGAPARGPRVVRVDPLSGGGAPRPAGLVAKNKTQLGTMTCNGSPIS